MNLFNWLVKIRTIKVSVLYDMHERSNSTFWEISIRRQRDVVKVRIFEKVKTCCSLDSHPNRNRSYETSQTDSDSYWGQCPILPSAFGGGALGQRRNQLRSPRLASRHLILQSCVFLCRWAQELGWE